MKRITFILACIFAFAAAGCKDDVEIGQPLNIDNDYTLPQGDASQADNDRIQQLYDKYGSYFLYNYTQKDVFWTQYTSSGNISAYVATLGDTQYVGPMLTLLYDVWLQFFPDSFLKKGGIPYRVFIANQVYWDRSTPASPGWYIQYTFKVTGKSVAFAGMNESLLTMTPATKLARKNEWVKAMWDYYVANGFLDVPNAFYEVSNYVTQPTTPINAANPANVEAYRQRGFLPSGYNTVTNAPTEWMTSAYMWTTAKSNDLGSYMFNLLQRTDEQMAPYLTYEPIRKKWDILVNHYKNKYGIDIRKIGNTKY